MILAKRLMGAAIPPSGTSYSFTHVAVASSTSSSITIPSSAQTGDIGILADYVNNFVTMPSTVVPSGWTNTHSINNGFNVKGIISCKILGSSDPGASITGMSGNLATAKRMVIVRPSASVASFSAESKVSTIGDGAPGSFKVTSQTPAPYLGVGVLGTYTNPGTWSTFSPTATDNNKTNGCRLTYVIMDTSGDITMSKTSDAGNANMLLGFALMPTWA